MTGNLHSDLVLDPGPFHVAHGATAQVVKEQAGKTGAFACFRPTVQMAVHWMIMDSIEHPWTTCRAGIALVLKPSPHVAVYRQRAGLLALRLPCLQPDKPRVEVDLLPSGPSEFVLARAGMIAAHKQRFETIRQFFQQPLVLILLQETLAHVVFLQLGNRRLTVYQRRIFIMAQMKAAADDGEFAVNRSVGSPGRAALGNELPNLCRAEPGRHQTAQHGFDVRPVTPLDMFRVAQIAQAIVFQHQLTEIRDRRLLWTRAMAGGNLAYALLQEILGIGLLGEAGALTHPAAADIILDPPG